MSIINFSNITKYFGNELILDHISFSINKGERVALIGNNGSGKTTILKLILKSEEPTILTNEDKTSEISILSGISIGYLDQNAIKDVNKTVIEELKEAFSKTFEIENKIKEISLKMEENNDDILSEKYDQLLEEFKKERGFTYQNEIDELLFRFGFSSEYKDKIIKTLSGGERMKIAFIKILLFNYDCLLLDEPTNHLDISTIEWLESFLKEYKGTILFISHDRYFLETLATKVIEIENKKVIQYNLDYNHYLIKKESDYNSMLKRVKIEEKEIEKIKRFIEFYKPKPRFVSRAKDREHKLKKLEENRTVLPNREDKSINLKIKGENLKSKQLLEIKELEIGYDTPLTPLISFDIYGQDRIAICGDNGVGKTTFLKTLIHEINKINGSIRELRNIKYGYIKQNDYIFDEDNPINYLKNRYPSKSEKELRNILGSFEFKGDEIYKSTKTMSNGEKMRLILCSFSLSGYDLLLLDEPTNHLDMVTKECLIEALKNYKGAILLISHDRYFINELASHVLYLSKNKVIFIEGDYNRLYHILLKNNEEITYESLKEIENPIVIKKEKLSNNKLNEYKEELKNIETRLNEINDSLENDDFVNFKIIEDLTDEKDDLEKRYLEVLDILESNKK